MWSYWSATFGQNFSLFPFDILVYILGEELHFRIKYILYLVHTWILEQVEELPLEKCVYIVEFDRILTISFKF